VSITINIAPDMVIDSITSATTSATVGDKVTVTVRVTNNGPYVANFTINIQWMNTVKSQTEMLAAGQSATYTITWDTTGYGPATAKISATIPPQQYETSISDNTATDGNLTLTAPQAGLLSSAQVPLVASFAAIAAIVVILSIVLVMRRRKKTHAPEPSSAHSASNASISSMIEKRGL